MQTKTTTETNNREKGRLTGDSGHNPTSDVCQYLLAKTYPILIGCCSDCRDYGELHRVRMICGDYRLVCASCAAEYPLRAFKPIRRFAAPGGER